MKSNNLQELEGYWEEKRSNFYNILLRNPEANLECKISAVHAHFFQAKNPKKNWKSCVLKKNWKNLI